LVLFWSVLMLTRVCDHCHKTVIYPRRQLLQKPNFDNLGSDEIKEKG
jgi:hypothetical protein